MIKRDLSREDLTITAITHFKKKSFIRITDYAVGSELPNEPFLVFSV